MSKGEYGGAERMDVISHPWMVHIVFNPCLPGREASFTSVINRAVEADIAEITAQSVHENGAESFRQNAAFKAATDRVEDQAAAGRFDIGVGACQFLMPQASMRAV